MRLPAAFLLICSACSAAPAWVGAAEGVDPPRMTIVDYRTQLIRESEQRIQAEILDRVLGPGKASVFVDVQLQLKARRKENLRGGTGLAERYQEKGAKGAGFATKFMLPGVPEQKSVSSGEEKGKPEAAQGQTAQQVKLEEEEEFTQQMETKQFLVKVLHESTVAREKLDELRELIVEAMSAHGVKPADVLFRPANYHVQRRDWLKDAQDPKVYLPLLYALLFLLLLLFLFGPVRGFLKRYTDALAAKPAAEVNVESNIEPPEDDGKGAGGDGAVESKIDMMVGRKAPEPPPPPSGEEDEMAKLEPFKYINEDNLKNLANLFQVRREEPWLIATVISYLRHDYARQVLTALPLELQTKVAMEALKVRQITREQLKAIDADIQENIDCVVGGVERFTKMLEESDPATRDNILESLKNERPLVYEYVRRSILLFEDVAGFPDREMEIAVRELKTETMARALQGASPEVVEKFFKNMSTNAASLLKESMEYAKDLTPAQIEEERAKIMEHCKTMEKEGKISLRRQGEEATGFQQVFADDAARLPRLGESGLRKKPAAEEKAPMTPEPQAAVDPARARQYFDAGAAAHQAGRLDEAVRYFRQAIECDPGLWQAYQYLGTDLYQMGRTSEALIYYEKVLEFNPDPQLRAWVESFKAQSA